MADVARKAGVALVTVSRAFSDPDKVSSETRARIAAAAAELGYVPNLLAGSLASSRSRIIAMTVPTLANSFFAETAQSISSVLRDQGYQLLLGDSGYSVEEEESLVRAFLGRQPDGFIVTGSRHSEAARALLAGAGIPVVETWEVPADAIDMAVGFSNEAAAAAMTEELVAAGYRRIGLLAWGVGNNARNDQRVAGHRGVLARHGLAEDLFVATEGASAMECGSRTLPKLVERWPDVEAVFCADDMIAVGALLECQRRGWSVPERIAIAGFGDFDIARQVNPGLTTIRIPASAIGAEAAHLLLNRLAGRAPAQRIVDLGFELVRRGSCRVSDRRLASRFD